MIYYLVPARAGSKRWPGKNRVLFPVATKILDGLNNVLVSTDDSMIKEMAVDRNFYVLDRPKQFAGDHADIICVLKHAAENMYMEPSDIIVMLYLVHPERTMEEIKNAIKLFKENNSNSLVCRFPAKSNPYKCIHEDGSLVISHEFYREQDFPKCYEIMHYIAIYKVSELKYLDKLAISERTTWLDIEEPVDIDYEDDYKIIKGV